MTGQSVEPVPAEPHLRVTMFVYGDVRHDSRVLREAGALAAAGHHVTVVARPPDTTSRADTTWHAKGFDVIDVAIPGGWRRPWRVLGFPLRLAARLVDRLSPRLRLAETLTWLVIRRFAVEGWARAAARVAPASDVVHGHDLTGIPAAVRSARISGARVVYDSHEVNLESGGYVRRPGWIRRRMARLEQAGIDASAAVIAVNEAVLAELAARYRLPPTRLVVHSCSPRWTPPAVPEDRIRRAAAIPPDAPVVLCHGGFRAGRGIEETAAALALPGFETVHLVFLGPANDVVERVQASFPDPARVHVLPVVPPDEVVAWVAGADVDVMVLLPVELNHVVSTPNKLFESIAAGVPVVSSDFPARRAIVVDDPDGPLGEVCDPTDPAAIAAALRRILGLDPAARAALRGRILRAAHARWNWETESAKLIALYRTLGETGS